MALPASDVFSASPGRKLADWFFCDAPGLLVKWQEDGDAFEGCLSSLDISDQTLPAYSSDLPAALLPLEQTESLWR